MVSLITSSIFNSITIEEELQNELGLSAIDLNTIDEVASAHDEELLLNDHEEISHEQGDQHLENDDDEHIINSLNNRFEPTNIIRQDARECQKRQVEEFLQNTLKKQKLTNWNVDDNVLIPVSDVDRGPTDARNVLAVIMNIKYDK
ncbi:unnamed protein product [Rotaria sp. Silwood2]|nr:unnamed protein product [Rotaria sp. Silwood2]CAF3067066.1 unnamed protein product [Rotaria sp. Silwood2]CAF3334139.1 unnamed protein product [Rotaria sp. Silwood2]CAF3397400.1 unnamed protein product [Rotaria sp. Silwood2]CAF4304972.1 unnamed protein product [Rotaria sp. Silwood2]